MKLKAVNYLVLQLNSWLQQLLGKAYDLRCQNGVMVNDSFAFRKPRGVEIMSSLWRVTL